MDQETPHAHPDGVRAGVESAGAKTNLAGWKRRRKTRTCAVEGPILKQTEPGPASELQADCNQGPQLVRHMLRQPC